MKKIIFCNIPMKDSLDTQIYGDDKNLNISATRKVAFPINAMFEGEFRKGDDIKVVSLLKNDINGNSKKNMQKFIEEMQDINLSVGATISFEYIESPFEENRKVQEDLLYAMVEKLEENSKIYCDITYGPKSLPIIAFSVMNFADKFFKCDISGIVYGKVDFVDGKPCNPSLFDMTSLYYLNALTNTMECDGENTKEMLKTLLEF